MQHKATDKEKMKGEKMIENNHVEIIGEIVENFKFSNEVFKEKFYICKIKAERFSGATDIIPVMVSERLIDVSKDWERKLISVSGSFRSYDRTEGDKKHLILSVFATDFEELEYNEEFRPDDRNTISASGYVCKKPIYRETPKGREIASFIIAVDRGNYKKSDYIPCICWGRNARIAPELEAGAKIKIDGRIQSREYQKKIDENEFETRTAYEVSVSIMEVVEDEQNEN